MKSWEWEELARREGREDGLKEGKILGHRAGLSEGLREGLREGEKKKALEIAKGLLDVLDIATIANKTGLSENEIIALKNDIL